jgi:hypothetical protein
MYDESVEGEEVQDAAYYPNYKTQKGHDQTFKDSLSNAMIG